MIGWRQHGSVAIALLCALALCSALRADTDVDKLEALLKELRILRKAAQTETDGFRDEKQRMAYLLEQRRRRLEALKTETAQINKSNKVLQGEVDVLRQKSAEVKAQIAEHRNALKELIAIVGKQLDQLPALVTDEDRKKLAELQKNGLPLDQLNSAFWNQLLTLANKAIETRVQRQQVDVAGRRLQADVLWLGALGAIWMTEDLKQGGVGVAGSGKMKWVASTDKKELVSIRHAIQVARKSVPANIVVVPVSAKGGGK